MQKHLIRHLPALALTAALGLAALGLAGCDDDDEEAPAVSTTALVFEVKHFIPRAPGTFIVGGEEIDAVRFRTATTPHDLHAHRGIITFTSVSNVFAGTFTLRAFGEGFQFPAVIPGVVRGEFSANTAGLPTGTFRAEGTVNGVPLAIDVDSATYAKTPGQNMVGIYRP
jgi:hypothetical protein